jgi:hypothetical protein
MQNITITFPYYCQPRMLDLQLGCMASYSQFVKSHIEIIVVDDCSPENPLTVWGGIGIPMRFFRTDKRIPWSVAFARNLAAKQSSNDWILFTDIDHLVSGEVAESLICGDFDPHYVYIFDRLFCGGEKHHGHKNSYFTHRIFRERLGGEDERMIGYGPQERDFNERAKSITPLECIQLPLILVTNNIVPDSKTTGVPRITERTGCEFQELMRERAGIDNWKPLTMSYPWHELHPDANQT